MTKVFSARPIQASRDADNSVSNIGEGAAPDGNQASPRENTARTRDSNIALVNKQFQDCDTLISNGPAMTSNGQKSSVSSTDRKTIRRNHQKPKTRGLMGLSVAVAVLCSLPMVSGLTCTYQIEKAGKCVDPTCTKVADEFIWTKAGICEKCPEFKTASIDHKTCIDPTCPLKKADEYIWDKTGKCEKCPGFKTADKDHKLCVEPKCASEYFFYSDVGKCEKCPDYKLQNKDDKGKCILKKCAANEKIEKVGDVLKCTECPAGKIAGGDSKEKCVVDFNL